jgi:hypothetical protein
MNNVAEQINIITKINLDTLVNILFRVKGVTFIAAKTTTVPEMKIGGKNHDNYMYNNVIKNSEIHCMLGFDYENRINKIAQKQWIQEAKEAAIKAGYSQETVLKSYENLKTYSETSLERIQAQERKWGKHMVNPETGKISRIMIDHTKKDKKTKLLMPETYKRYMQVEIIGAKSPVYRYKDTGKILSSDDLACVQKYLIIPKDETMIIRSYAIENIDFIQINKRQYKIVKS